MRVPPWLSSKESTCNAGAARDPSSILGSGRSLGGGHGNPFQYSSLENPMDRGGWQTTVFRVAKNQTWLKRLSMQAACGAYPGGSVVKNLPANARDPGLVPGWRTKIPHALEQLGLCAATTEPSLNHLNVSVCRSLPFHCSENIQVFIFHPFYPQIYWQRIDIIYRVWDKSTN